MKTLCVTLLTVVSFALNASAISFQGTFTGTATVVVATAPLGFTAVGDTFSGTYSYDSPIVDGSFSPNSANLKVTMTFPDSTVLTESDEDGYPSFPILNVSGGSVVGLLFIDTSLPGGGLFFSPTGPGWAAAKIGSAEGTLSFSNPSPARVGSVPDAGGSALLLGLACLGLLSVRRYRVAA